MGVKINDLIESQIIDLSELQGTIIAIDAPNIINAVFNISWKNSNPNAYTIITDRTQRPISHLYGLLYRIIFYYSKKILPVFCFDGRVSDLKKVITKNLLNDYRYTERMYEKAMEKKDFELARKIAFSPDYLWPNIFKESKELLNAMGVPVIESPASAESQCAQLVKDKIANFSNSQDYDSLLFGCPRTIQNLSKSRRRKQHDSWTYEKIEPLVIDLNKNLTRLGITQFQLVDMALLIGCDYFDGIKSIGSKTALKLIKKHGGLETVIAKEKNNYDFRILTMGIIRNVRKLFLLPDTLSNIGTLSWNYPDESRIRHLTCENHHLNEERVMNNVKKLVTNYIKCVGLFESRKGMKLTVQKTLEMVY